MREPALTTRPPRMDGSTLVTIWTLRPRDFLSASVSAMVWLSDSGAALSDLEVRRAGLADAFLEITRDDTVRDAAVQEAA